MNNIKILAIYLGLVLIVLQSCSIQSTGIKESVANQNYSNGHSGHYKNCTLCNPINTNTTENTELPFTIINSQPQLFNAEQSIEQPLEILGKNETQVLGVVENLDNTKLSNKRIANRLQFKKRFISEVKNIPSIQKQKTKVVEEENKLSIFALIGFISIVLSYILFFLSLLYYFYSPIFFLLSLILSLLSISFCSIGLYETTKLDKRGYGFALAGAIFILLPIIIASASILIFGFL